MIRRCNKKYFIRNGHTIILILLILLGCNPVRYVPENQYLLKSNKIQTKGGNAPDRDLEDYFRQQPNKKIFGFWRFHLDVYNLSNPAKKKGFSNWLRKIGEEPVIYNQAATNETLNQLKRYLKNIGYYNAKVDDTVSFSHKRASVVYRIDFGPPYVVDQVRLTSPEMVTDTAIGNLIRLDSTSSLLKPAMRYDLEVLRLERMRLSNYLRDNGYYGFSREYVYFQADTMKGNHKVDVWMGIKNPKDAINDVTLLNFHPLYRIGNISIMTDFNTSDYLRDTLSYLSASDTIIYQGTSFLYKNRLRMKPSLLYSSVAFKSGSLFSQSLVDKTIEAFSSLRNFKQIKINFTPTGNPTDSVQKLDCQVLLSPMIRQSYDVSLEGTYSSGNIGVAGNLIYKNRNLLRGAESFELKFKGAVEFLANSVSDFNRMVEFGVDARLEVPRSWIPFTTRKGSAFGKPHSSLNLSYNYQQRPDFTRTIVNAAFGYNWKLALSRHQINIFEFNYVNVTNMSDRFYQIIKGTYFENSFRSHMVPALNYTYTLSNQEVNKQSSFFYVRLRPEIAGNVFYGYNRLTGHVKPENGYELFKTPFSQYAEVDVDLRYHRVINSSNKMAFRFFAGAGYPYGNSDAMPFEKKYFSGGSSGIRAWQVRSLGPGTYVIPEDQKGLYPNQLGDIKLEASAEYRFDLFSIIKGAIFVDAGNIWAMNSSDDRPGSVFKASGFYREIAVGTGFGIRADFSYFVGRLDLGIKLRDPGTPDGPRWIPGYRKYQISDFVLNFGIGYPF
ncbi:MAG: outer membrane protein assembly factor [Porphyromonadaceae bacterium]|nr:MAG: outer membrane protein assembly factor [Porphyromonadaceae bacterium]